MTIFAGAISLASNAVPAELKASLRLNLRHVRDDSGTLQANDQKSFFLIKWDSGAFAEPAWLLAQDGSVCALAGDPLLMQGGSRLTRTQQLERLALAAAPLDTALAQCRGSFALARFDASQDTLTLATDVVGLRSIYYVIQDGFLIFATALRVLEAIPGICKELSSLGMAEQSALSFPLADRTPYEGVLILRESEVLAASRSGVASRNYYDWSAPEAGPTGPTEATAQLYEVFHDAVRIRAGVDQRVYSFLSGGMDSRAIVATLVGMGRQVVALNFSATASQDQRYAQLLAGEMGSACRLHCLRGGNYPNFSFLALAAKTALEQREATAVDRPQFIWSGDGGSVGLGHVYMNERMLDFCDRGDIQGAMKHFLEINRVALPCGVLTAQARRELPQLMLKSVMSEVNRYPREDLGRRIYLFLLFNDQRRHLFKHFETIDQHGLELLTPFFDAAFLRAIASMPARWGILHRLYDQFFQHLPAYALKTPWQTYPGHVPCPLPPDQSATYQWSNEPEAQESGFIDRTHQAIELVGAFSPTLSPQVFSQSRIWLAALMHALGLRDCRHILPPLQIYRQHNAIAQAARKSTS